jgi:nucleotide-binding universal stress UspA family protein
VRDFCPVASRTSSASAILRDGRPDSHGTQVAAQDRRGIIMTAIKRILCPVDFSDFSRHALDSAVAIARHQQATVTALYVIPPVQTAYPSIGVAAYVPYVYTVDDLKEFQKSLERFVGAVDYPVIAVTVEALVVDEILKRAAELPADLIVMGTHGRSGFDRLVLGSVAERVLVKAICPVLTIPRRSPDVTPANDRLFRNILCPIDFSPSSRAALDYAEGLVRDGAQLQVLHVTEQLPAWQLVPAVATGAPDDPLVVMRRARERVHTVVSEDLWRTGSVDELVSEGDAGDAILKAAADRHVDLIVMGAHAGRAGLLGFGSTTHDVLRGAACPVLSVRA